MNSLDEVWKQLLAILGEKLTPVAITTWFRDCSVADISPDRFVLLAPSSFKKTILETRFRTQLNEALFELFSGTMDVVILSPEEKNAFFASRAGQEEQDEYVFDRFVVGPSNRFAYAAAKAVAEGSTKEYNPLFIYGNSGLGKTHLLYAIRAEIRKRHPEYSIVYVKGDDFTNELVAAIRAGKNMEFREKYRNSDLFLMDDIQFIAGKQATQEEFFHTFNALYEAGRQIVFTSDRPPEEILLLTDRLKSRFQSGLIADVQPPSYETRVAILTNKSVEIGLVLPDNVAEYIAKNITSNVRQLEGAVKKLHAYQELMGTEITVPTAAKAIADMYKEKTERIPTPEQIMEETSRYFNVTVDEIKGAKKTKQLVLARQTAMYLTRQITALSLNDIGEAFDRDHTTVLNSIRKVEAELPSSRELTQAIKDITSNVNSRE